jgi:epoxyqueuosine reductase
MNDLTVQIRDFLLENGADLVGFADLCDVPGAQAAYGISIGIKLPRHIVEGIYEGPTGAYYETYKATNAKLNAIVSKGAEFLLDKGYQAQAQTTDRVVTEAENRTKLPHKTVAIRAGLGWIGTSNLLITPQYGGAVRLSTLLTDAPLTTAAQRMASLCGDCQICRTVCPAEAIKGNVWNPGTDRDDMFDMRSCEATANRLSEQNFGEKKATICGRCFALCPFTQSYLSAEENS